MHRAQLLQELADGYDIWVKLPGKEPVLFDVDSAAILIAKVSALPDTEIEILFTEKEE